MDFCNFVLSVSLACMGAFLILTELNPVPGNPTDTGLVILGLAWTGLAAWVTWFYD